MRTYSEGKETKIYPEQSPYVKGNKVWLEYADDKTIIISPQARKVLEWSKVDEELFIRNLQNLLECFSNIPYPFHRISVSKASVPELSDEDSEVSYITISIKDQYGRMGQPAEVEG